MSETNTNTQGSNDTSLPQASGTSDVYNESDEKTQSPAIKALEGCDRETESVSSTQTTTRDDPADRDVSEAQPKRELDGKKEISDPETETFQTEENASTPGPEAQSEAADPHDDSLDSESIDGRWDGVEDIPLRLNQTAKKEPELQLPVKVDTITAAEGKRDKPEMDEDEKQICLDEPPLDTLPTAPHSSHEGVEDVPRGIKDVPREGVEVVPDGRRRNISRRLKQPEKDVDEKQDEEPVVQPPGNYTKFMLIGILGLLLSISYAVWLQPKSVLEKVEASRVDVFLHEMDRVQVQFPSQYVELWRRSKIHLKRHLQTDHPKEPASLILTAGRKAERTLHCLAQGLASALSSALNGSVLQIDGDSMAGQDSSQVKFDIDDKLRRAFEGDQPVAVIHRFEELPPGSTIIFYRYCDHENAAYKRASLIFTVLLEGKEEVSANQGLSAVEEMVDDHLKDKFLSSNHPAAFDSMDTDKLSGLWSRISHLILPVAAEERIEKRGCSGT